MADIMVLSYVDLFSLAEMVADDTEYGDMVEFVLTLTEEVADSDFTARLIAALVAAQDSKL